MRDFTIFRDAEISSSDGGEWILIESGAEDGMLHTLHSAELHEHTQSRTCRCRPVVLDGRIVNHRSWRPGATYKPLEHSQ